MKKENCELEFPPGVKRIEIEVATLAIKDGILYSLSKKPPRTLANVRAFMDAIHQLSDEEKVFIIADTTLVQPYTQKVRAYFNDEMRRICKAIAIVSCKPLGKMVPTVVLLSQKPPFPARMFEHFQDACDWIKELKKKGAQSAINAKGHFRDEYHCQRTFSLTALRYIIF